MVGRNGSSTPRTNWFEHASTCFSWQFVGRRSMLPAARHGRSRSSSPPATTIWSKPELSRVFVDLLHHPALMLELVDVVLKLLVEHHAISDDDDAVEDALVALIVQ